MKKRWIVSVILVLLVTACKQLPGQNQYDAKEVGVSHAIRFGTVLSVREVPITGKNSETGTLIGAGAGAGGGSYVHGGAQPWAIAGGAIIGAVAGHLIEQEAVNRTGYEYIVHTDDGHTKSIVQEKADGDVVFKKGDRVMIQYCEGGDHYQKCSATGDYQRLLPTDVPAPKPSHHRHHPKKPAPPPEDADAPDDTDGGK